MWEKGRGEVNSGTEMKKERKNEKKELEGER